MRTVLLLALLGATPRNPDIPRERGDGIRVTHAPERLSARPDVVEVARGLVWLVSTTGQPAYHATQVGPGVWISAAGYLNVEKSVDREVGSLKAEIATLKRALEQRSSCTCVGLPEVSRAGQP